MESLNIAKTQVRRGPSSRAAEPETATAVYGVQSVGGTHFQVCDAFSVNPPGIGESKINEATCDAGGVPRLNARVPLGNQSGRHVRDSNFNPRGKRAPSESESRSSRPQRIQPKRKPKRLRTNSNAGDPPDSPQTGGVASQETLSDTQMSSGGSEQRQVTRRRGSGVQSTKNRQTRKETKEHQRNSSRQAKLTEEAQRILQT